MDHDQIFTLSDKFNESQMQARPCLLPRADHCCVNLLTNLKCIASLGIRYNACAWRSWFTSHASQAFVGELHSAGQRWVPILDPVVHISTNYSPYQTGLAAGVFMRDLTGAPYIGEVGVLASIVLVSGVWGAMLIIAFLNYP